MGNYFKRDPNVGLIMGIWVGTSNFGDVLGLLLGDIVLERLKWQLGYGIIISASFLILVGLMDILVLQPVPMNVNIQNLFIHSNHLSILALNHQEYHNR